MVSIRSCALLGFITIINAFSIAKRNGPNYGTNGVVEVGFNVNRRPIGKSSYIKGTNEQSMTFDDNGFYDLQFTIGSNNHSVTALIDTGSSDLVFDGTNFPLSPTGKDLNQQGYDFSTVFNFFSDTLSFGTTITFDNFVYGNASFTNVFGIGPLVGEAINPYPNLPYRFKDSGYTNKAAFSIYLNHLNSGGTMLFGGIDHDKYTGDLMPLDIITSEWAAVNLTDILLADGTIIEIGSAAALDTGTPTAGFTDNVINEIHSLFGEYDVNDILSHFDPAWYHTYMTFQFEGKDIKVPYTDFLQQLEDGRWQLQALYPVRFLEAGSPQVILGDTFLRNAYTVSI